MPMGPALFVVKPVLPAPYLERLFPNGPLPAAGKTDILGGTTPHRHGGPPGQAPDGASWRGEPAPKRRH